MASGPRRSRPRAPGARLRLITSAPPAPADTFSALGVKISVMSAEELTAALLAGPRQSLPLRVHFATARTLLHAAKDIDLREALNEADLVLPADASLALLGRLKGKQVRRLSATRALLAVLERSGERGYRHFFLTGDPERNQELVEALRGRSPGLEIFGASAPPLADLAWREIEALAARINEPAPDYVWLGLRSPHQDDWLAGFRPLLDAPVIIAVGESLERLTEAGIPSRSLAGLRRLAAAAGTAFSILRLLVASLRLRS